VRMCREVALFVDDRGEYQRRDRGVGLNSRGEDGEAMEGAGAWEAKGVETGVLKVWAFRGGEKNWYGSRGAWAFRGGEKNWYGSHPTATCRRFAHPNRPAHVPHQSQTRSSSPINAFEVPPPCGDRLLPWDHLAPQAHDGHFAASEAVRSQREERPARCPLA
jgi:hypothetical protein